MVMASRAPLVDSVNGILCGNGIEGTPCANDSKVLAVQTVTRALSIPTVVRG